MHAIDALSIKHSRMYMIRVEALPPGVPRAQGTMVIDRGGERSRPSTKTTPTACCRQARALCDRSRAMYEPPPRINEELYHRRIPYSRRIWIDHYMHVTCSIACFATYQYNVLLYVASLVTSCFCLLAARWHDDSSASPSTPPPTCSGVGGVEVWCER